MSNVHSSDEQVDYVRISSLSKYLGWSRTKVYYWLERCPDIQVIQLAGFRMVRSSQLPRILMRLRAANEAGLAKRGRSNG